MSGFLQTKEFRAIASMCAAMLFFVGNDTFNKLARDFWPTGQVLATRGAMAIVLFLIVVRLSGHWDKLDALVHKTVLRRGVLEGLVAVLFIAALGMLPLQIALAAIMTSTLFGTALSVPILGEKVGWRRWGAILLGFAGMLLVLRPTGDVSMLGAGFALACAMGVAIRDLATRFVPREIPSVIVTLATVVGAFTGGVVLLPFETPAPFAWEPLLYLAGSTVFVLAGNFSAVYAFREVEIGLVSPFRYTNLFWGLIAGWFVFGEWPTTWVWVGVALIMASGLYTLHRERIRHRQREKLIAAGSAEQP
jgi:drug/metabolite transporter (DMT)-like permease